MKKRDIPSPEYWKARKARKERRQLANRLSRTLRLGGIGLTDGRLNELVDHEWDCQDCGERGRVFWVSRWVPLSELAPHLGSIACTPYRCAACTVQRVLAASRSSSSL